MKTKVQELEDELWRTENNLEVVRKENRELRAKVHELEAELEEEQRFYWV